ncbi:MAG: SDR family oxidoreductase [Gammaproteobacteria bacterium]|nr:SDR family oxidoreductase [Gammaproteobacteria bacterium]
MKHTNVLIAGCGDVGSRLANRLLAVGCSVWGLRRDTRLLPEGVVGIAADLADKQNFPALPSELDSVVYCAAAGRRSEEAYRNTYVHGMQNILAQIKEQNIAIKRFIFASSTAVYHQDKGEVVNEYSLTEPLGFSGQIMLEAECCLAASGLSYSSLRFGGIYGPGRNRLRQLVEENKVKVCEEFAQYTNRIHSDDCAAVLQHLLEVDAPKGCYIAVDSVPATKQEVTDWLAQKMNVPLPKRINQSEVESGQNKRCSNALLLESGYRFIYPSYREGYRL